MTGRATGLLLAVFAWPAALHGQVDPRYASAVVAYAAGQRGAAVDALGSLPWGTLDDAWRVLQRQSRAVDGCRDCPDPFAGLPVQAAVMLHVDRDFAEAPASDDVEAPPTCLGRHARRAGQIAGLLARRTETRNFARRFYLAMTWRSQWHACLEDAVAWGRDGLVHFGGDADLLLAIGASFEKQARIVDRGQPPLLRQALKPLLEAVAAAPDRADTRVHLGRVQWRLGQLDEAQHTLEAALKAGGEPDDRYLASLFLGQVHERAGRGDAAAEAFRGALATFPQGQAAAVALAHLLLSRGDGPTARELMDGAMSRRARTVDPNWNYVSRNAENVLRLLEDLRGETRR